MKYFAILLILSCSIAQAAWNGPKLGEGNSGGGGGGRSKFGIRFLAALKGQHASFGSKSNAVKSRKLNGAGIDATLGLNYGSFLVGVGGEYAKFFQQTEPKEVNDTNLSGSQVNISAVAGVSFWKVLLLGKYYFKSDYTVDKKSAAGDKVSWNEPNGSYGIALLYRPGGSSFWSLDYTMMSYLKEKRGGQSSKLDSKETMEFSSIGLSYGFMF